MTPCEQLALQALAEAALGCFSGTKRFVCDLSAKPDGYELTARQKWNLSRLAWRYRKQLPREVSDWALETYAGADAPPVATKAAKVARERKTKADIAREALKRPLRFGDVEQARANRILASKWRMI